MESIVIVICIIAMAINCIWSILIYKRFSSPMVFMNLLWFVIMLFSTFRFFGFNSVSWETYFVLTISLTFFNFGCCVPTRGSRYVREHVNSTICLKRAPDKIVKRMRLYNCILAIGSVCELINVSYYYIAGFDTGYIRGVYFSGSLHYVIGTDEFWELFRTYISLPLLITVMIVSVIWFLEYKNWKQLILTISYIIAYIMVSYSRFIILYFLLSLIFAFIILSRLISDFTIRKELVIKWVRTLSFVGIVTIVGISLSRGLEKFLRSVYEYFCGCVFLLDQLLQELPNRYTYGIASFKGIIAPIYTVLRQFLKIPYADWYFFALDTYAIKDKTHVISSEGMVTNAFGTHVFSLILDGGYIYIFIGMFLWGMICSVVYRKMNTAYSEKRLSLYLLIMICIIKTIQEYPLSSSMFVFSVLYILFLYRGENL